LLVLDDLSLYKLIQLLQGPVIREAAGMTVSAMRAEANGHSLHEIKKLIKSF
jgi:hypothetical protein